MAAASRRRHCHLAWTDVAAAIASLSAPFLFVHRLPGHSCFHACHFVLSFIVTRLTALIGCDRQFHALPRLVAMCARWTSALHRYVPSIKSAALRLMRESTNAV